jgi:hypothetical protein
MAAVKGAGNRWLNYIMRTTGPQQFYSFPFVTNQNFNVPKNIPLNQPLAYIHMQWVGRIVIGTANYTSVSPESLLNIIANFKLNGTHASLGNQTPFNISGASLFKIQKLFNIRGNSVYIGDVRLTDDVLSAGIPTTTFGNTGTYDVIINWTIPVFPLGLGDAQALLYTYNAAAWNQTLQLTIQTGDLTSFGVPAGGTTVAFSQYGSGSGSPTVNLLLTYISLGPLQNSVAQAVKVLNDIAINSVLTANASVVRLALLQNQKTTAVLQKTGTSQTSTSGIVYATLSDSICEQTILRVNNNPIRNLLLNSVTKEFYGFRMNTVQPQGYLGIFFDDGNPAPNAWTAIQGQNFPGGAQFDIAANVIGAAGGNIGDIIQEYIVGTPVSAS